MLLEVPNIDVNIVTDFDRGTAAQIAWRQISSDIKKQEYSKYIECIKAIHKHKNEPFDLHTYQERSIIKRSSSLDHVDHIYDFKEGKSSNKKDNFYSIGGRQAFEFCNRKHEDFSQKKVESVLTKFLTMYKIKHIPFEIFKKGFEYYCYTGYVGRYTSMAIKVKYRWLKLSPIDGSLIEYKEKNDCPNKPYRIIPLHTVDSISIVNQKWLMKKSLFYWEIIQYGK